MPRYILIDANSGYVFGDTADLGGRDAQPESIVEAARLVDEAETGVRDRAYEEVSRLEGRTGYLVYRADVDGSEAVPVVVDGQDPAVIAAVETKCRYVGSVLCIDARD